MADGMTVAMVYIVSFFIMYIMATAGVLIFFKRILIEAFRKRFMIRRGYGYVRINKNDKSQKEYFVKLTGEKIKIAGKVYFVDPKKLRFKGNAAVYEYKEGIAEPLDVYAEDMVGTDPEYLDGFLMKMKSLARVSAAKEMQMVLYAAGAAAIGSIICTILTYTNYNTLMDILKIVGG